MGEKLGKRSPFGKVMWFLSALRIPVGGFKLIQTILNNAESLSCY
jgi:hypothetical protein